MTEDEIDREKAEYELVHGLHEAYNIPDLDLESRVEILENNMKLLIQNLDELESDTKEVARLSMQANEMLQAFSRMMLSLNAHPGN